MGRFISANKEKEKAGKKKGRKYKGPHEGHQVNIREDFVIRREGGGKGRRPRKCLKKLS